MNKGSVSVTADGVKTYSEFIAELYELVDFTKVTKNSCLQIGTNIIRPVVIRSNSTNFIGMTAMASTYSTWLLVSMSTTPIIRELTESSGTFTHTDRASSVPINGVVIELYY